LPSPDSGSSTWALKRRKRRGNFRRKAIMYIAKANFVPCETSDSLSGEVMEPPCINMYIISNTISPTAKYMVRVYLARRSFNVPGIKIQIANGAFEEGRGRTEDTPWRQERKSKVHATRVK